MPVQSVISVAGRGFWSPSCWPIPSVDSVVAVDVSARSLEIAGRRLNLDQMSERQRARLQLFQSSLTYLTSGCAGWTPQC